MSWDKNKNQSNVTKTVLITGCSSGFGLETAKYFLEHGWKVIATMRSPKEDVLPTSEKLRILALDITKPESISEAIKAAGPIDALVNNAGFGLVNAFEGVPMEQIREIFETNTFGTMAMIQAVLPQMRQRKAGVIVNVSSSVTIKPFPMLSIYSASKAAINAFTESLALEVEQFNVRVRLVLPGRSPETSFADTAKSRMLTIPDAYSELAKSFFAASAKSSVPVTHALDVAKAVWLAVNELSSAMRIPAGADAVEMAVERAASHKAISIPTISSKET